MRILKKFIDFYLYSSIHIALGAALSVVLCYAVLVHIPTSDYPIFVFTSTIFIYCSHRILGIKNTAKFLHEGRYAIVAHYKLHIIIYAIAAGLASIYFFIYLPRIIKIWIILPALVSVFYILPIFSNRKRLRDFGYIKIFLIAIIWSLIIGVIPYVEVKGSLDHLGVIYALEKAFFIFAITIPFDVRDITVDNSNKVKTIPSTLGIHKAYKLSYLMMALVIFCVIILYYQGVYSEKVGLALGIGYQISGFAIKLSKNKISDYYFSGLLDGTIALIAILGITMSGILGVLF